MRHRRQARLTRAVAGSVRRFGILLRRPPPRYTVTVSHAGESRALEMDTRAAALAARRFLRREDGAIVFEFAPGAHAYLVQRGNPARFAEPHRVAAFPSGNPGSGQVRLSARGDGGSYPEGCRLYVQYHDERQRLASFSLGLRGPSQTTVFKPPSAGAASIAIRLAGAGVLPPLVLGVGFESEAAVRAGDVAAGREIADFDRMALVAAGAASCVAGVYDATSLGADPGVDLAARRLDIRPDQGVPVTAALPVLGLVFDDTILPPFGWQGVFDENIYANMALVRILGQMERAELPTILVYDGRTETKPFFPELAALFAHQIRKGPGTPARIAEILRLA